MIPTLALGLIAFTVAAGGTYFIRQRAMRLGLIDVPNQRSSHSVPTPRGGGLAIVVAIIGLTVLARPWNSNVFGWVALLVGGVLVAAVGFIDDKRGVAWSIRLAVHVACVSGIVAATVAVPPAGVAPWSIGTALGVGLALTLAGTWAVNLFNFMDGIDGLATGEAAFIALGGLFASPALLDRPEFASVLVICGGACLGFLVWNRPRASIFMGDVGSGFLGFWLVGVGLMSSADWRDSIWMWVVLWGAFAADATVTLVRRIARRARWHEAHRSHAYQRLARRWNSHGRVSLFYIIIDVVWLWPLARLAAHDPAHGPFIALLAWSPLLLAAVAAGAGSEDER